MEFSSSQVESTLLKAGALLTIMLATGWMARRGVRVNYTRKLNHVAIFFLPVAIDRQLNVATFADIEYLLTSSAIVTLSLLFFWEPIRSRFPPYQLMFEGFDRPEDRPFTLVWIFSQFVAGFMVMLPAIWYFGQIGLEGLILIPLLINAVGDGLAEPIGVRWGRHEYRTRALWGDRTYVRTLEGSGFILLTGLVIIALHASQFSGLQFALALAIVPLAMTLAEAFSPHTWDTPFLMAAGYGGLLLVMQF